ncbi:MAG: DUF2339 domain-containing protein [Syntrophobacteraceae bacterium]
MKTVVLAILGGVIGASLHDVGGFLLGGAVGACLGEILKLRGRLLDLERSFVSLQARVEHPSRTFETGTATEETKQAAAMAEEPAGATPEPTPDVPAEMPPSPPDLEPEALSLRRPMHLGTAEPQRAEPPPSSGGSLLGLVTGWLTGGNLLVKVGILVLFVGVAFLMRYAAERNYLPIELRLIAVAVGAGALLGVGWRLRERRRPYALVLQGGAVAVLYLTVFAAMRLYGLIPAGLAFPLLVVLGAVSGAMAILQDARVLATFGIAGGFAAPILTSTGQGSHVLLFSYYAVLNLGVVSIAWYKAWRELNLIGFVFTFAIGTAWGVLAYRSYHFATTEPFLILFFLFYVGGAILFALRQPPDLKGYVDGTLVFGLPIIAFALQNSLVKPYPYGLAWSAFSLAGFYITLAWVLFLRAPQTLRLMAEAFLAIGTAFGTLAIPLALDNRWTAAAWAMEGAALIWIGCRQGRLLARIAGELLIPAAGIAFLIDMPGTYGKVPFLNGFWLGGVTIGFAGLFGSYCLEHYREGCRRFETIVRIALGVWGLVWWYGTGMREIEIHVLASQKNGVILLFLAVSSILADNFRVWLAWPFPGYSAWALVPLLLLFAVNLRGENGHPSLNGGWWGWLVGLGSCGWLLWRQDRQSAFPGFEKGLHPPFLWLLVWVITWEVSTRSGLWTAAGSVWSLTVWGILPALCVVALTLWGRSIRWPVQRHESPYLVWGSGGLCVFVWLWVVGAALPSDGNPWPLPFLPILNPLDITVAIGLLSVFLWQSFTRRQSPHMKARMEAPPWSSTIPVVYGLTVFAWLNTILARTLHHWGRIGFTFHELFRSMTFQASVSILWGITALCVMVLGTRKRLRGLWIAGASLMGVTVVKLFLVDLAKAGTLGRVVSFISVGILILVVGYFSPVPPRGKEETEA